MLDLLQIAFFFEGYTMSNSTYPKAKSLLFVSSIKPENFMPSFESEADAIILDLEDSVPSERKDEGRANVLRFCRDNAQYKFFVRVNDAQSPFFADDMKFLLELGLDKLHGVMLAKTEQKAHIESVINALGEIPLLLLIESALGVQNLPITASQPCAKQLAFGAFDMILDLGLRDGEGKDFMLNYVRTQMALASRINNLLPPINRVFPNTRDESRLKTNMELAYSMGFGGSLTFYPNQLAIINAIFTQGNNQIEWAKEILRLVELHKGETFSFEGNVVDIPMIKKAQGILERKY